LGALAAAPGSVAMLAHRRIPFRTALARWRFRFKAGLEFFPFAWSHHFHVGNVRSALAWPAQVLRPRLAHFEVWRDIDGWRGSRPLISRHLAMQQYSTTIRPINLDCTPGRIAI
jgi:hypothetical protein